ncbi:D-aminoacyl-tRNA deacylase [Methanolinea mesophila]|uniref:D-aminoacyl-tRNA deacylase n=1 Tax=Methanolinea mesophila TaxID=547055 RepID=UPI001AEAA44F|nr:D-aminoacyl-tRNA deacylase [Methanolinea mesophila]MBP1929868.1 D-aminoacyl-tRNA deacylase [Methanolinea mesophila]
MKIALISSLRDPGGTTIHNCLDDLTAGEPASAFPLYRHEVVSHRVGERLIYQDFIDRDMDADLIIFLSRHSSVNPVPVLTVHVTGNISAADFGGLPGSLPPAAPAWMQAVLRNLALRAPPGYRVAYEVTHHGPSELSTPSFFVEVGSTEKEWRDTTAGYAVAGSVLHAEPGDAVPLIGFGGTHYATRQTEIAITSRGAFGHIAHSREVGGISDDTVRRMAEQTGAVAAYIDKKALSSGEISRLDMIFAAIPLIRLSETELINMGDLSFPHYLGMREIAAGFSPDARLHLHRFGEDGSPVIVTIPEQLLFEAMKTGGKEWASAMDALPLAHISTPKKPVLPSFITTERNYARVLHDLISLCVATISKDQELAVDGEDLLIRRRRLDPRKARELGIPQGPMLGELMKGRPVTIGSTLITPGMVTTCEEKKIHIPGLRNYL